MGVYLGTGNISHRDLKFKTYIEAKKYAQTLKLKNLQDWKRHVSSDNFPKNVPSHPESTYKKEFEGFPTFLGNIFKNYKETRKYARSLKLKNFTQWIKVTKSNNFPKNIYKWPDSFFKKTNEWKGWPDFFGTSRKPRSKKS